jgi:hypothetical protein
MKTRQNKRDETKQDKTEKIEERKEIVLDRGARSTS